MKIAMSADWHIANTKGTYPVGSRTNREIDLERQVDVMCSVCDKKGVDYFLHVGDISDKSMIDSYFLEYLNFLLKKIESTDIIQVVMPGNHDWVGARNPITSAIRLIYSGIDSVHVIEIPSTYTFKSLGQKETALLIPHVSKRVYDGMSYNDYVAKLLASNANVKMVVGHFQPMGVVPGSEEEMFAGSSRLVDPKTFPSSMKVFCGHVHKPQQLGNIHIIGSPIIFNIKERDDKKRFIIYDTEEDKIESHILPTQKFYKVKIDLATKNDFSLPEGAIKKYEGSCVGIVIETTKENRAKISWDSIYEKFDGIDAHIISKRVDVKKSEVLEKTEGDKKATMTPAAVFKKTCNAVVKDAKKKKEIERQGLEILEKVRGKS